MSNPTFPDLPMNSLPTTDEFPQSPMGNSPPPSSPPPLRSKPVQKAPEIPPPVRQIDVEMSRRHLLPFVQLTKPDYIADRFHVELCKIVEDFHRRVQRKQSSPMTVSEVARMGGVARAMAQGSLRESLTVTEA